MVAKEQMLPVVEKLGNIKKHGSMPRENTECFCRVAETYFGSCKQKLTLEKMFPVRQNWETLASSSTIVL